MTLRGKILLKMAALLGCFGLLGAFSVLALASLREKNRATEREFGELQAIRSISVRLAASKGTLEQGSAGMGKMAANLQVIRNDIRQFLDDQQAETEESQSDADREHDVREREHAEKALQYVEQILSQAASTKALTSEDLSQLGRLLDQGATELDSVADTCAAFLHLVDRTTHSTVRTALVAMSAISLMVLIVTAGVGISVYRSVVLPLRELNSGMREISLGHFTKRLPERGAALVLIEPIPGQEERNSDYLLENGAAVKVNNLASLSHKLTRLVNDPQRLRALRDASSRIARPCAAFDIARSALALIDRNQPAMQPPLRPTWRIFRLRSRLSRRRTGATADVG